MSDTRLHAEADHACKRGKIDVHAHFLPPVYRQALKDAGLETLDGGFPIPDWHADTSIAAMDSFGIDTAIVSVSSPCVHFIDGKPAQRLARSINEAGAELVATHPGRFGAFASLPLPDVASSIAELAYALDELNLDGVIMETNAHGVYLGHESLDPLYAELNQRGAAMLIHPTSPACYEQVANGRPAPMIEFHFDTTRAVVDLLFSRRLTRYPDIKVIVPHGGALVPLLAPRLAMFADMGIIAPAPPDGGALMDELKHLYFDLAASAHPALFALLRTWVPTSQILFGSDWPFTPATGIARNIQLFDGLDLSIEQRCAMEYGNALRLFPKLAALNKA